jgi:hypothetical protein
MIPQRGAVRMVADARPTFNAVRVE